MIETGIIVNDERLTCRLWTWNDGGKCLKCEGCPSDNCDPCHDACEEAHSIGFVHCPDIMLWQCADWQLQGH